MSLRLTQGDWGLELTRPPAMEPLSLSQAKAHLRILDDHTEFDDTVSVLITTARSFIEENYGLPVMQQGVRLTLSEFPHPDRISIPIWPVQSVDAMSYVTADNVVHPLSLGRSDDATVPDVLVRLGRKPCELILPFAHIWPPAVLQTSEAVRVDMTVGFGTGASPELLPLPGVVIQAMKLLIGHYFENPEAVTVIGRPSEPLVLGIDSLLSNIRLY